jgi:hypothetical protein
MARGNKGGMIGSKVALPPERHFTNAAEINDRDKQAHQNAPTTGNITGPEDSSGKNAARMSENYEDKTTSGLKFSGFSGKG